MKNLLQKLNYPDSLIPELLKWRNNEYCPECNEPSCRCLDDLSSIKSLYDSSYKDIELPTKVPMCDKQSKRIDKDGRPWCYVHRHTDCCGDNQPSSQYPHLDYSYQACEKPRVKRGYVLFIIFMTKIMSEPKHNLNLNLIIRWVF